MCVDIMHNVLEGVAPLEAKLLLRQNIYEEKLLSLEQLNDRIINFDYGYSNDKNKPNLKNIPKFETDKLQHKCGVCYRSDLSFLETWLIQVVYTGSYLYCYVKYVT